ncbi:MAG: response regulator [Oligoflexia bacterium]|nr:response regulator [Oligoflexia bacterium]
MDQEPVSLKAIEKSLDGLYGRWREQNGLVGRVCPALLSQKGLEAFSGKRLAFVDDVPAVAALFAPELLATSWGRLRFFIHAKQQAAELAQEIANFQPDIVIMDGMLQGEVRGWDVTRSLLAKAPQVIVLGFSSDSQFEKRFIASGASGFVHKRYDRPMACLLELASIVRIFMATA